MRNGFLGAIMAFTVGAGLAHGQYVPGGGFGGPSVIPPPLPGMGGGDPGMPDPNGAPGYPPPANWEGFDLNGPGGNPFYNTPRLWIDAEYVLFYLRSSTLNTPVLTTGSLASQGIIGNPTTSIVFGSGSANFNNTDGFRIFGGYFFDADRRFGFNVGGFGMDIQSQNQAISSNDNNNAIANATPLFARPFVNSNTGAQASFVIGSNTFGKTSFSYLTSSQTWSVEANLLYNLFRTSADGPMAYSASLYAGYRHVEVNEKSIFNSVSRLATGQSVTVDGNGPLTSNVTPPEGFVNPNIVLPPFSANPDSIANTLITFVTQTNTEFTNAPVILTITDSFRTKNHFDGGNFGLVQDFKVGRFTFSANGRVSLGNMNQTVDVEGSTVASVRGGTRIVSDITQTNVVTLITTPVQTTGALVVNGVPVYSLAGPVTGANAKLVGVGGLYAQKGNIGHYSRNTFTAIPELNLNFGYQLTPTLGLYAGYSVVYFPNVIRPNDLISGVVNPNLTPVSPTFGVGAATPLPFNPFVSNNYLLQGINFGVTLRY